jgi:hypothetical protein
MPPAFDSTKQAAAFLLLLLFLLAAPWLSANRLLPQAKPGYSSESIRWRNAPWAQKFIFEETNDIDIAFVGSSHMLWGMDTPYVQQKLEEQLGRKAVVRSICWADGGFDAPYFFTRDLLAHRRVKTLVFYDECWGPKLPEAHKQAPIWFRFGRDGGVLSGLPLRNQAIYYYAAVIGMPKNLLALLVSNLPGDPDDNPAAIYYSPDPETRFGCMSGHLGFSPTPTDHNTNFIAYVPQTRVTPADLLVYSVATASNFVFSVRPLPESQLYFARQFGLLAKKQGCSLVDLHLPLLAESTSPVIVETRNWADLMNTEVCLMGIPGGRLFDGLSEEQVKLLYCDPYHLNANGQGYFTRLVTPAIIQFYENHAHP